MVPERRKIRIHIPFVQFKILNMSDFGLVEWMNV